MAFGVATTGVLPMFLVAATSVQMREDLAFGNQGLGAAISVFFVGSAILSPVLGRLVQRLGGQSGMRMTAACSLVAVLAIALPVRNWLGLLLALLVAGAGNALGQPTANLALMSGVSAERRGLAFGAKQASVPAAGLLAGAMVPLVAETIGWRWTFAIAALAPLALLVAVRRFVLCEPPPIVAPAQSDGSSRTPEAPGSTHPRVRRPRGLPRLATGAMLGSLVGNAGSSFLVPGGVDIGLSAGAAGTLLAAVSLAGLVSRVGSGVLGDRLQFGRARGASWLLLLAAVGFLLAALGTTVGLVVGAFLALAIGWAWPVLVHWEVASSHKSGAASGTGTLLAYIYVGAATGPVLFGFVVDRWSFAIAWGGCAAAALVSALFLRAAARERATQS